MDDNRTRPARDKIHEEDGSSFLDINRSRSIRSEVSKCSNWTVIGSERPESISTVLLDDGKEKDVVICMICMTNRGDRQVATHFCRNCKPYGKYLCYYCLKDHDKPEKDHDDVFSLSVEQNSRKEVTTENPEHTGNDDDGYTYIESWLEKVTPDTEQDEAVGIATTTRQEDRYSRTSKDRRGSTHSQDYSSISSRTLHSENINMFDPKEQCVTSVQISNRLVCGPDGIYKFDIAKSRQQLNNQYTQEENIIPDGYNSYFKLQKDDESENRYSGLFSGNKNNNDQTRRMKPDNVNSACQQRENVGLSEEMSTNNDDPLYQNLVFTREAQDMLTIRHRRDNGSRDQENEYEHTGFILDLNNRCGQLQREESGDQTFQEFEDGEHNDEVSTNDDDPVYQKIPDVPESRHGLNPPSGRVGSMYANDYHAITFGKKKGCCIM